MEIDQRRDEIAKMLGDPVTQGASSLQHADVLLRDAQQYREEHPVLLEAGPSLTG
jgi:hypothetical protein